MKAYRLDLAGLTIAELRGYLAKYYDVPGNMSLGLTAAYLVSCYTHGKKSLWFGNGGSAAQADHIAAELMGRFRRDRPPLAALSLNCPAIVTAIGNDYGYDKVFERQVEALGETGDVAVGLTTSGQSVNVLRALEKAREMGLLTVIMTGDPGSNMELLESIAACVITTPPGPTEAIQERHLQIGHMLCRIVESVMFPNHQRTE